MKTLRTPIIRRLKTVMFLLGFQTEFAAIAGIVVQ